MGEDTPITARDNEYKLGTVSHAFGLASTYDERVRSFRRWSVEKKDDGLSM
jgi:hypothetical protein